MKLSIALLGLMFVMASSVPVPGEESIDLVKVPLSGNKELDILTLAEQDGSINDRNKRTIGILRELFPQLSKLVEQKIQMLVQFAVRTFGPILLRGGLGGAGGSTSSTSSQKNDDFDDFDDDNDNDNEVEDNNKAKVNVSLPTYSPPEGDEGTSSLSSSVGSTTADDSPAPSRIDLFDSFDDVSSSSTQTTVRAVSDENLLEPSSAGSDALLDIIRVARETNNLNNNQNNNINNDQESQASEKSKDQKATPVEAPSSAVDELTLDNIEDDENRDKRFLDFGGSAANGQANGASGGTGGSGNFLFDIIRQTADRVARGAGSAFRVVAGTQSIDSAIKNLNPDADVQSDDGSSEKRSARSGDLSLLVSGSSGTEQTDETHNGVETDVGKGDGYTEGIPGPVTRLFVLANRGLSNLVQDLILRIAQTSERVVNFKARLITSLI